MTERRIVTDARAADIRRAAAAMEDTFPESWSDAIADLLDTREELKGALDSLFPDYDDGMRCDSRYPCNAEYRCKTHYVYLEEKRVRQRVAKKRALDLLTRLRGDA